MIVRLACANGDLLELEGAYHAALDVVYCEAGVVDLAEFDRVADDPDGAWLFREVT